MSFNTEIAAAQFEAHSDVCPLCNTPGSGLCWLGLRLLDQFYSALLDDLYRDRIEADRKKRDS